MLNILGCVTMTHFDRFDILIGSEQRIIKLNLEKYKIKPDVSNYCEKVC